MIILLAIFKPWSVILAIASPPNVPWVVQSFYLISCVWFSLSIFCPTSGSVRPSNVVQSVHVKDLRMMLYEWLSLEFQSKSMIDSTSPSKDPWLTLPVLPRTQPRFCFCPSWRISSLVLSWFCGIPSAVCSRRRSRKTAPTPRGSCIPRDDAAAANQPRAFYAAAVVVVVRLRCHRSFFPFWFWNSEPSHCAQICKLYFSCNICCHLRRTSRARCNLVSQSFFLFLFRRLLQSVLHSLEFPFWQNFAASAFPFCRRCNWRHLESRGGS